MKTIATIARYCSFFFIGASLIEIVLSSYICSITQLALCFPLFLYSCVRFIVTTCLPDSKDSKKRNLRVPLHLDFLFSFILPSYYTVLLSALLVIPHPLPLLPNLCRNEPHYFFHLSVNHRNRHNLSPALATTHPAKLEKSGL